MNGSHVLLTAEPAEPIQRPAAVPASDGTPGWRMAEAAQRVLHRTAQCLASTPGGLRFVAGSRPWLRGLPGGQALGLTPSPACPQREGQP